MHFQLIEFNRIPSTNLELENLLKTRNLAEGSVVFTNDQYMGKGQEGNYWESEPGKNLTFSILFYPVFLPASKQFQLNKMISLAVTDYLKGVTNPGTPVSIKWPNDIYIGNKKAGGILFSNSITGLEFTYSVAGIGLNINQEQFTAYCPNPTSLRLITRKDYLLNVCLNDLLACVAIRYLELRNNLLEKIDRDYLSRLYQYGESRGYIHHGNKITGMIKGVNEYGQMILETTGGEVLECDPRLLVYLPEE